jgi:hypothetical protein
MEFIEGRIFHEKRRNLTVLERLLIDFSDTIIWWHLLKGTSSTIREGIWRFTKGSRSILLAQSRDGIYLNEGLPRKENEFDRLRKAGLSFYWMGILTGFIEWEPFHDKRRNFIVYERVGMIVLAQSRDGIYWGELFHDKRRNLIVYERLGGDIIGWE